jgi:hypothetical protein
MLTRRFVGPPAPPVYAPRPLEGWQDEQQQSFSDLWPLIAAQALDFGTTEMSFRNPAPGVVGRELNPLPGMQSTAGRLGWGLLETLLAHELTKGSPKLRKTVLGTLPGLHGVLALNNAAGGQGEDVIDMLMRARHQ